MSKRARVRGCDDCRGSGVNCSTCNGWTYLDEIETPKPKTVEPTSVRGDGPATVERLLSDVLASMVHSDPSDDYERLQEALTAAYEAGYEDGHEKARSKAASDAASES